MRAAKRLNLTMFAILGVALALLCGQASAGIDVFTGDGSADAAPIPAPEVPAKRPETVFDSRASNRMALIVSMQDYDYPTYDVRDNATPDGDALAESLRGLGYRIMRVRDADQAGLDAALGEFAEAVTVKSTIVVSYTGLGVALPSERDNRLLPADLTAVLPEDDAERRAAVAKGSVTLSGDLLARIKRRKPAAMIVMYDGCTPDTARALGGSSCRPVQIRNAATVYAAGPGAPSLRRLGDDDASPLSVFARAAIRMMDDQPALRIAEMLRTITERVREMTDEAPLRQSPVVRISLKPVLRDGGLCFAPGESGCEMLDAPELVPAQKEDPMPQVASAATVPSGDIAIDSEPYRPFAGAEAPSIDKEATLAACDLFAANPGHSDNPEEVKGVAFADIDATKALPACLEAVKVAPENLRIRYQLARAKQAAEQHKSAIRDLLSLAQEHRYPAAMNNLGSSYQLGLGVEPDDAEAVRWYKQAADKGFVPSMAVLGWMYQAGKGIAKDNDAAFKWYTQAAEAGFAPAMNNLGFMYQNGWGVEADMKKAATWFVKSAEAGLPAAMSMSGWLYEQGRGVEKDMAKSLEWYGRAADKGMPSAMGAIGGIYDRGGDGVERAPKKAADWFLAAIGRKHEPTYKRLIDQPDTLHLDTRQAIQAALEKHDYDPGPADGVFGAKTRDAIEKLFSGN